MTVPFISVDNELLSNSSRMKLMFHPLATISLFLNSPEISLKETNLYDVEYLVVIQCTSQCIRNYGNSVELPPMLNNNNFESRAMKRQVLICLASWVARTV